MKDLSSILFDDATTKLNTAREELYRPEEDVVFYLVDKNSQQAIEKFLMGFLIQHKVDTTDFKSLDSLYKACKIIDNRFSSIDITKLNCDGSSFTNNCFEVACKIEKLLDHMEVVY